MSVRLSSSIISLSILRLSSLFSVCCQPSFFSVCCLSFLFSFCRLSAVCHFLSAFCHLFFSGCRQPLFSLYLTRNVRLSVCNLFISMTLLACLTICLSSVRLPAVCLSPSCLVFAVNAVLYCIRLRVGILVHLAT
jgi:hypothetical protein